MNKLELAEWIHDEYEFLAEQVGWATQGNCKVPFNELPMANRRVLTILASRLLKMENVRLMEKPDNYKPLKFTG